MSERAHKTLLEKIDAELPNNVNWWASFDYISYLKNTGTSAATYYDLNSNSSGIGSLTALAGLDPVMCFFNINSIQFRF